MSYNDMSTGFVYCLTIPRMEGVVKIGYTQKTMEERLKALDNTSVVEPMQIYYAGKVNNPKRVEALIHECFKKCRIRANREFFEADPADVKRLIHIAEAASMLETYTPTADEEEVDAPPPEDEEMTPAPAEDEKECLANREPQPIDARLDRFKFKKAAAKK